MARPYFDAEDPAHIALLRENIRDVSELKDVAAAAEYDVIAAWSGTQFVGNTTYGTYTFESTLIRTSPFPIYCYLRNFTTDPEDSQADPMLVDALRRTIAQVIEWRVSQWKKDPVLRLQYANATSLNYMDDANAMFPANWRRRLHMWDVRPEVYYT